MTSNAIELEPLYSSLASDPMLAEIVDMFVEEMPARVETLRRHHQNGDLEGLRTTAHQLKGAAGSYGFDTISPCAAELENAIRNEDSSEAIDRALTRLVDLCGRVSGGQGD